MTQILIVLLLVTFLAGIIQGISGFAYGIVLLAVMQCFMPYTQLLGMVSLLGFIVLGTNAIVYRKYIVWKQIVIPIIVNFAFTMASIRFLNLTANFPYWNKLLGIFFIGLSLYMSLWQKRISIRPTFRNAFLFSALSGILGGLFGVNGPPMVLYYLSVCPKKSEYLGTIHMFFTISMAYDFMGRCLNGMVTIQTFQYAGAALVTSLLGLLIGNMIFKKINGDTLKVIVYALMCMDGLYMLLLR